MLVEHDLRSSTMLWFLFCVNAAIFELLCESIQTPRLCRFDHQKLTQRCPCRWDLDYESVIPLKLHNRRRILIQQSLSHNSDSVVGLLLPLPNCLVRPPLVFRLSMSSLKTVITRNHFPSRMHFAWSPWLGFKIQFKIQSFFFLIFSSSKK